MEERIPTVDLRALSGAPDQARAAAAQLREAFSRYGLVYLSHHGVESSVLDAFYAQFLAFVEQPLEVKRELDRPDLWYQRGWTPPNTEQAVVAGGKPDFKECYFAAPQATEPALRAQYPEIFADNVWPEGFPHFPEAYLALGRAMHGIGGALLRGCALALDLAQDAFTRRCEGGPHVTRALKYLPLTQAQVDAKVLWGEEHTDFNLLTLLPGGRFFDPSGAPCGKPDDDCGLWLRTRDAQGYGGLVSGISPPGTVVAQVGQQLEILSGGAFLATPHVIVAPKTPGYSRASAAHFVHMHPNELLFPLPPFQNDATLEAYRPPVLASTYDLKTLVDIGLAPRSAIERLGYRHYERLADTRG